MSGINSAHYINEMDERIKSLEAELSEAYRIIGELTENRKHGQWEFGKWDKGHWVKGNERMRCSECHRDFPVDNLNIWHGCPQCMAHMRY